MDGVAAYPLRRAVLADVPALAALYADCAKQLGPQVYGADQVAAWASFGTESAAFCAYILDSTTWVALDGAGPAGFCGVDSGGEVHSLYVRPELTRQGLGLRLLLHAQAHARAAGQTRFSAWATPFSLPVFERAGMPLVRSVREAYQGVEFERHRVASE